MQAAALRAAGVPEGAISIIPDEQEAVDAALRMGEAGDLLLVFADARRPALVEADHQVQARFHRVVRLSRLDGRGRPQARKAVAHAETFAATFSGCRGRGRGEAVCVQPRWLDPRRARHPLRAGDRRLTVTRALPFDDSRRLTGNNQFFASTCAALEVVGIDPDEALVAKWRARVERAVRRLGWAGEPRSVARRHAKGMSLAVSAPYDQLFTATEVNEWALCSALHERDPSHWGALKETLVAAAIEAGSVTADTLPPEIDEEPAREAPRSWRPRRRDRTCARWSTQPSRAICPGCSTTR